jgi:phosphatidate cytidylyltransferase
MPLETSIKERGDMVDNNLIKRFATALMLIPAVLYINHYGGLLFDLFLFLIFGLSTFEVVKIVNSSTQLSVYKKLLWIAPILSYIFCSLVSLKYIRSLGAEGNIFIIYLFIFIWGFDSAAYFAGSTIGGPKLLPKISPKKTWAGLIGGCVATFFVTFVMVKIMKEGLQQYSAVVLSCLGVLIGVVGQIGDLLESHFKRKFDVKDSGSILPGHGGVLDRLDSLFLAAIFFYVILQLGVL